ncbi:MAG: hypothetical protein PVI44_13405 [Balneolaceae bacterium]
MERGNLLMLFRNKVGDRRGRGRPLPPMTVSLLINQKNLVPKNSFHQPTRRLHFDRNPECLRDEAEKSIMAKSVRSFSRDKKRTQSPFYLDAKGRKDQGCRF